MHGSLSVTVKHRERVTFRRSNITKRVSHKPVITEMESRCVSVAYASLVVCSSSLAKAFRPLLRPDAQSETEHLLGGTQWH